MRLSRYGKNWIGTWEQKDGNNNSGIIVEKVPVCRPDLTFKLWFSLTNQYLGQTLYLAAKESDI